jgi:hypothetical protein
MREADRALESLRKEVERDQASRESLQQAVDQAAEAARRAAGAFDILAEDFPVFALEEKGRQSLEKMRDHFEELTQGLQALDVDSMAFDRDVAALAGEHREQRAAFERTREEQERFVTLGKLLEQTADYRVLLERQELLLRWFERYAYALPSESREPLERLARHQRALRQELEAWMNETGKRVGALHPEDADWARQALEMIHQLKTDQAADWMRQAAEAAENKNNTGAVEAARKALEAMRGKNQNREGGENPFENLCRGNGSCTLPGDALGQSLRQLLDAMRNPGGGRSGRSGMSGGGVGGFSDDGFAAPGSSPLHIPMQGPNRHRYDLPYGQAVEGFSGTGGDGPAIGSDTTQGAGTGAGNTRATPAEHILEQAPPRYREAMRRFYDIQTEETP